VLLQACIGTAPLGSAHTETLLVNFAVAKDGYATSITASITAFSWWITIAPRWQWTATGMAASNCLLLESIGTYLVNAMLLLANFIAAISPALANTGLAGATITLATRSDVSASTQRMMLLFTCHSAAAVASCLKSGATVFSCRGTDTTAPIYTSDSPKTTVCFECAASVHEARLWTACILLGGSGLCEYHTCSVSQQIASASTETCNGGLLSLNYASAGVRSQGLCFLPDPVSFTDTLSTGAVGTTVSVMHANAFVSDFHG
jgi:hypothetical protein